MVRLWRISEWAELDGAGGMLFDGRWHDAGRPIVYIAESSALALLEVLVAQPKTTLPAPYQLIEIDAPDELGIINWSEAAVPRDTDLTRAWGNAFLHAAEAPLARVPSVIAPHSWNYLLNPLHPDAARVTVAHAARWPWDARLFAAR